MFKLIVSIIIYSLLTEVLSQNCNTATVRDVAFTTLGKYRGFAPNGSEYQKTWLLIRNFIGTWMESKMICKAYDLDLASFETLSETQALGKILQQLPERWYYIDGKTLTLKSKTDWYWSKSGKKVDFIMPWAPGEPNNFADVGEYCLVYHQTGFQDVHCQYQHNFGIPICERTDFVIPARTFEP